jgi:hypothetical protein
MLLPVPYLHGKEVEIKKISTNTILDVYDIQSKKNKYEALFAMLQGSIETLDGKKPSVSELRLMPMVDVEYIVLEAFKLYGLPTKLEGIYSCPRIGCGNRLIHEVKDGNDSRHDLNDFEVKFSSDIPEYKINCELTIKSQENEIIISSMTFRDFTIGDIIEVMNSGTIKSKINSILYATLIDMEFVDNSDLTFEQVKSRYKVSLFNFPKYETITEILNLFRSYGIQLFVKHECNACGKEWNEAIDFTSFFDYALSSQLREKAER